jgi:hypothetical protein
LKKSLFILSIAFVFTLACSSDKPKKNVPDVSNIQAPLQLIRIDSMLLSLDTNNIPAGIQKLEAAYPSVMDCYFKNIMTMKTLGADYKTNMRGYLTSPITKHAFDTLKLLYTQLELVRTELSQAIKFYHYYFPKRPVPNFYTFPTDMTTAACILPEDSTHSAIGIGLDMFLGNEFSTYKNLEFPVFVNRTFNKKFIPTRAMNALIEDLVGKVPESRLLDIMIHNGKRLYLLDLLLPNAPDSLKFLYPDKQIKWCFDNEAKIWASFTNKGVLYSSKNKDIQKLVSPSPNSPNMPPEAPGETANFIGWQIIDQFMQRNPNTTMEQLVGLRDAQDILNRSKYKPRL